MITGNKLFPALLTIPLLLSGFGMALFFHGTQGFLYGPMMACLACAGLLLLLSSGMKNAWPVPRSRTAIFIALYWLFLFAAMQWSPAPYISTYFFFIFNIVPFLFFAMTMARKPQKTCAVHAAAVMALIALLALWALTQFFFLYDQYGPRIRHPFLDPNSLAGLLNLGLLPALALFMAAGSRAKKALTATLFCLLYAALLATQSRAGLLAAGTAILFMLPFLSRPLNKNGKKLLTLLLAGIVIPCALWLYSDTFHGRDLAKTFLSGAAASMTDRGALWSSTGAMIRDHFWTGTGLATFSYHYGTYRLPVDRSDGYFAHMDPLQFWAEMGVFAPILFYAVLICVLLRTLRALNETKDTAARAKILGPFGALLALALHTHLNYHLYMPALLVPSAILLAYWYAVTEDVLKESRFLFQPRPAFVRYSLTTLVCFAVSFAVVWSAGAALSARSLAAAERHLSAGQIDEARKDVASAARRGPRSKPQIPQYEAKWRRMKLLASGAEMDKTQKRRLYDEALAFLDEAQRRQPALPHIHHDRARLFFAAQEQGIISDGNDRAVPELEKVLRMDPVNIDARMGLARIYMRNGDFRKAQAVLDEGLRWPRPKGQPDLDFLVMTARLHKQRGDTAGHDRLINEALARAKHYGLTRPARK